MKNKSFTLIELLVVIVIIGILAGVIMISTSSSIDKASIAKLKIFEEGVANNLAANMVSRWKLDEGTGTTANDIWGSNGGTLTNIANPSIATSGWVINENECVAGKCLRFDAIDDSLYHPQVYFPNQTQHSFSVWVKWGTTTPSTYVIPFGGNFGSSSSIYFADGSSKVFYYRVYGQAGTVISGSNTSVLFDNNWHYIIWTVDSLRNVGLYRWKANWKYNQHQQFN